MLIYFFLLIVSTSAFAAEDSSLYRWADSPQKAQTRIEDTQQQLDRAYENPELMLHHDFNASIAPAVQKKRKIKLSLREAILLALRYNPNVQNAEIDRILQRYALRVAENQFEWQYALTGSFTHSDSASFGSSNPHSTNYLLTPAASLNTSTGATVNVSLPMQGNTKTFNPVGNVQITQPLLRGAGSDVALSPLRTAYDQEEINKLTLQQNVINVINAVIASYRSLVSANQGVLIQLNGMKEAEKTIKYNEAKIKAGQLETTGNIQQQAQVEQLRVGYLSQIIAQRIAEQTLLAAIGLDPDLNIIVPDDVEMPAKLILPELQKTVDTAIKKNLAYRAVLINHKIKKRLLLQAIDQQLWQLNATASASIGTPSGSGADAGVDSLFNGRNRNESIGLNLSVPVNDLARRQQLIQAKLQLQQDIINLSSQERALISLVKTTLMTLKTQIEQLKVAERSVELAKRSYELEIIRQRAGISSSLNVTNTQNLYLQSQSSLIASKISYLNTVTALQAILATTLDEWGIKLRYGRTND